MYFYALTIIYRINTNAVTYHFKHILNWLFHTNLGAMEFSCTKTENKIRNWSAITMYSHVNFTSKHNIKGTLSKALYSNFIINSSSILNGYRQTLYEVNHSALSVSKFCTRENTYTKLEKWKWNSWKIFSFEIYIY
jgi:hypothetical protein